MIVLINCFLFIALTGLNSTFAYAEEQEERTCAKFDELCFENISCTSPSILQKKKSSSSGKKINIFESSCMNKGIKDGPTVSIQKYSSGGIYRIEKSSYIKNKLNGLRSLEGEDISECGGSYCKIEQNMKDDVLDGEYKMYVEPYGIRNSDTDDSESGGKGKKNEPKFELVKSGFYTKGKKSGKWAAHESFVNFDNGVLEGAFKVNSQAISHEFNVNDVELPSVCSSEYNYYYTGKFLNGSYEGLIEGFRYIESSSNNQDSAIPVPVFSYNFKNGKLNGKIICWRNERDKLLEVEFLNGLQHGSYSKYSGTDGNVYSHYLAEQGQFENNKRIGKWKFYCNPEQDKKNSNSKIEILGEYEDDKPAGSWETFECDSGKISAKESYLNGKKSGIATLFDYKNNTIMTQVYNDDTLDGKRETKDQITGQLLEVKLFALGEECENKVKCATRRKELLKTRKDLNEAEIKNQKYLDSVYKKANVEANQQQGQVTKVLKLQAECQKQLSSDHLVERYQLCMTDAVYGGTDSAKKIPESVKTCHQTCESQRMNQEVACESCSGGYVVRMNCITSCRQRVDAQINQCRQACR